MKYEVYCRLYLEDYITVDAEDEESAEIEAAEIFADNIKLCNSYWKEAECSVVETIGE